jgi:hypothetical protein
MHTYLKQRIRIVQVCPACDDSKALLHAIQAGIGLRGAYSTSFTYTIIENGQILETSWLHPLPLTQHPYSVAYRQYCRNNRMHTYLKQWIRIVQICPAFDDSKVLLHAIQASIGLCSTYS